MLTLRESIRRNIARSGLTYEELSERSGVSTSTLSHWCVGENWPTLYTLVAVADVLGLSLDEMIGREVPHEVQ